jgi:tetratricopeptide (TPR) repeat protein
MIARFRAALVAAAALAAVIPQRGLKAAGGDSSASESVVIGGSVRNSTIQNTVIKQDPALLALMAKTFADQMTAATEARAKAEAKAGELSKKWGFTKAAVAEFFKILGEQNIPEEKIPARLVEIATHFTQTREELTTLEPADPRAAVLARRAKQALDAGRLTEADGSLDQAKEVELAAFRQARDLKQKAQEAEDRHALSAAKLIAGRGNIALTQLSYTDAAEHFKEASTLVPSGHPDETARYLHDEADALYRQGDEQGDNAALEQSIDVWHAVLQCRPRERVPTDWARTQTDLGNALVTLGQREPGTERLQKGIAAYRAALEVNTPDPVDGVVTQSNLGAALEILGERQNDAARLDEAVAAYRAALAAAAVYYAALEEGTGGRVSWDIWAIAQLNLGAALQTLGGRDGRNGEIEAAIAAYRGALDEYKSDRAPLQWAKAHIGLGNALLTLGERNGDAAGLKAAVESYRGALTVCTRQRAPVAWALAQNNLGKALWVLAQGEPGTEPLQQAVKAYREALEVRTRGRMPLDWAMTENNLAIALKTLGDRENDTARLGEAVSAYRRALEEYTPERAPRQWAQTEMNLGNALADLGERSGDAVALQEAVADFRAALARDPLPVDVASLRFNMGSALVTIGRRTRSTGCLDEALRDFQEAEAIFRAVGIARWAEASERRIVRLRGEVSAVPAGANPAVACALGN